MAESVNTDAFFAQADKANKGTWNNARGVAPAPRGESLPGGILMGRSQLLGATMGFTKAKAATEKVKAKPAQPQLIWSCVFLDEVAQGKRFALYSIFGEQISNKGEPWRTAQESLEDFANTAKLLGVVGLESLSFKDAVKACMEYAKTVKPVFLINTVESTSGDPPRKFVNINVQGLPEGDVPADEGYTEGVEDDAPAESSETPADETPAESSDEWAPAAGEEYVHKGRRIKIGSVDADAQTVAGKTCDKKGPAKNVANVPWADLEAAE